MTAPAMNALSRRAECSKDALPATPARALEPPAALGIVFIRGEIVVTQSLAEHCIRGRSRVFEVCKSVSEKPGLQSPPGLGIISPSLVARWA